MRRFLALLLLAALPHVAAADPVKVSADESVDRTRLILEFDEPPRWDLQRRPTGYRIRFLQAQPLAFDLSRVFRLIGRDRVADIRSVGNNSLEIDLRCPCNAHVGGVGETAVFVDFRLPSESPHVRIGMEGMPPPPESEKSPQRPTGEAPILASTELAPFPLFPENDRSSAIEIFEPDSDLRIPGGISGSGEGVAVDLVARALARAAAQGLVTADGDIEARLNSTIRRGATGVAPRANLSAVTSFDRAIPSDAQPVLPSLQGAVCLPNASIDVAGWGDAGDSLMLGRLRGAAIAEDGSVDIEGAGALARYYIFLGFGSEARAAARFLPNSPERAVVEALADIMDRGQTGSDVFRGQVTCAGSVSLWATLAGPLGLSNVPETTNPLLATFSALPAHLRTHLGPLLSERLHEAGLEKDARTTINAVTRGGTNTDESELASARLELDGTQSERARANLAELANGTDATAAAALLELLEDAEAREMPPNPAWVDDAPTLVGVLEGREIAAKLDIARMKGLIALGRFDEFRTAIADTSPGVTPSSRPLLARLALSAATERGSDADFVTSEVALSRILPVDSMESGLRTAIAERLLSIGLASRAGPYVGKEPETLEDLSVAVRVLIKSGRNGEALSLLRRSHIEDAEVIRAQALVAAGEAREAMTEFMSAGQSARAVEIAIRAGDWDWVAGNGDTDLANAARGLLQSIPVPVEAVDAPNTALIEASRTRRTQAEALLRLTRPGSAQGAFTN